MILFHGVEHLGLADLNSNLMLRVIAIRQAAPHRTLLVLAIAQTVVWLTDSRTHTALVSTIIVFFLNSRFLVLIVILLTQDIQFSAIALLCIAINCETVWFYVLSPATLCFVHLGEDVLTILLVSFKAHWGPQALLWCTFFYISNLTTTLPH